MRVHEILVSQTAVGLFCMMSKMTDVFVDGVRQIFFNIILPQRGQSLLMNITGDIKRFLDFVD